jgi:hypothetical protein
MGVNVDPRLRDVMPLDTIDIPAGVQALADTLSSFVPCYDGEDERDAEWDGADLGDGGVCILRSDPAALYVLNPDSGVWARFAPEGLRETGAVGLVFTAGATESAVATVTFAQAFETPPIVNIVGSVYFASMPTPRTLTVVLVDLPKSTGFKVKGVMDTASTGGTITLSWTAEAR